MGPKIKIILDQNSLRAELNETETAKAIAEELPVESRPNFWGDEIYFSVPVDLDENEHPETELTVGDLAYWPEGSAFCIFFGPTPASEGPEPRPASPVTVIGRLVDDPELLRNVDSSSISSIEVEKH